MFFLITIITLWSLLINDAADLQRPIPLHSLNTLHLFLPGSLEGVLLWAVWFFVIVVAPTSAIAPASATGWLPGLLRQLGGFTQTRSYLGFVILALVVAMAGWILGIASALLFGGVLALGLTGNLIEQKARRP